MADPAGERQYRRVILKLSGESFCEDGQRGISMEAVTHVAQQTFRAASQGVQIAIVIGGGNILRGAQFTAGNTRHSGGYGPLHGYVGNRN